MANKNTTPEGEPNNGVIEPGTPKAEKPPYRPAGVPTGDVSPEYAKMKVMSLTDLIGSLSEMALEADRTGQKTMCRKLHAKIGSECMLRQWYAMQNGEAG